MESETRLTQTFVLCNPYSLRTYLRLHGNIGSHQAKSVVIRENAQSKVCVSHDTIQYVMMNGGIRYEVIASYKAHHVLGLSEFVFTYSPITDLWHQIMHYANDSFVCACRNHIRSHLHHAFYTIQSSWQTCHPECMECPWFYGMMMSFEQTCTPKTSRYIHRYVHRLKQSVVSNTYRNRHVLTKMFSLWKQWYYHPDNTSGYATKLALKYGN